MGGQALKAPPSHAISAGEWVGVAAATFANASDRTPGRISAIKYFGQLGIEDRRGVGVRLGRREQSLDRHCRCGRNSKLSDLNIS